MRATRIRAPLAGAEFARAAVSRLKAAGVQARFSAAAVAAHQGNGVPNGTFRPEGKKRRKLHIFEHLLKLQMW